MAGYGYVAWWSAKEEAECVRGCEAGTGTWRGGRRRKRPRREGRRRAGWTEERVVGEGKLAERESEKIGFERLEKKGSRPGFLNKP